MSATDGGVDVRDAQTKVRLAIEELLSVVEQLPGDPIAVPVLVAVTRTGTAIVQPADFPAGARVTAVMFGDGYIARPDADTFSHVAVIKREKPL